MYKKKGLSSIVATVSLVLLTFLAVVIVAGFVIPMVREGLKEGIECNDVRDYFVFNEDFGYNCYRTEGENFLYGVSIEAKGVSDEVEENVVGFLLPFTGSEGESIAVEIGSESDWGNGVGKIRSVDVSSIEEIPESGEVKTYVYNSSEKFESVSVRPKLESGKLCDKSDSIKINVVCEEDVVLTKEDE
ncbi:MAG: hypothetical protein ABIG28_03290 [archaeon]